MAVTKKATKKVVAKTTKKAAPKATKKVATKKVVAKKAAPKATKKVATKKVVAKKAAPKATKKVATKKVATKKVAKAAKPKVKRAPNPAFMKPLTPSNELAAVVGSKPLPRTAVVSKIWDYIKKHNLQNPSNKRNILADEILKKVFGKGEITMFELAKIVGKHLS